MTVTRQPDPTAIQAVFDLEAKPPAGEPVPMIFRRAREGEEPSCYADPRTGRVYTSSEGALNAIRQGSPEGRAEADARRREQWAADERKRKAGRLVKAKPVPAAEWRDPVYDEDHERVYDCLGAWTEEMEAYDGDAPLPAWIFATASEEWTPSPGRIIDQIREDAEENAFEDAGDHLDLAPLRDFLAEWAPKQALTVYNIDTSRVIVLDQARYEAELVEARKLLEALA